MLKEIIRHSDYVFVNSNVNPKSALARCNQLQNCELTELNFPVFWLSEMLCMTLSCGNATRANLKFAYCNNM